MYTQNCDIYVADDSTYCAGVYFAYIIFILLFQDAASRKDKFTGYRLMTSVSIPVFDKNNHTVSKAF